MMEVHPAEARLLLALDRELDAPEQATVEAHVRTCPSCRATWDRYARLSGEIAEYCRTAPPLPVMVTPSSPSSPLRRRVDWIAAGRAVLASAAAVVLIGTAWLGFRLGIQRMTAAPATSTPVMEGSRRGTDMPLVSMPAVARGDAAPAPTLARSDVAVTPVRRRPRPSSTQRQTARQTDRQTDSARKPTYYWTLPYSNGALPLSEGSVVMTVRLSRDQLRLAGIPVSELQPVTDKPWVRAKVLVGADGLPRAIAFDQD